jgi:hypothetical protein
MLTLDTLSAARDVVERKAPGVNTYGATSGRGCNTYGATRTWVQHSHFFEKAYTTDLVHQHQHQQHNNCKSSNNNSTRPHPLWTLLWLD